MRIAIVCLVVAVTALSANALGYEDDFDCADGAFPEEWDWTGDPQGEGAFLVYDGAFTHVSGGYVYYVRNYWKRHRGIGGVYELRVLDSNWVFAWSITDSDPMAGRSLCLSHSEGAGGWGYTFSEVSWETLDPVEYPEGQYMWHNGTVLNSVTFATDGPLLGWHRVVIFDSDSYMEIWADGDPIIAEFHDVIPDGFEGLGCMSDGVMTPAFDYVRVNYPDPVAQGSWSSIKGLYR